MVELLEYVIAFGISAGIAGASVLLVEGVLPGLNQVAAQSGADQVAGAARIAVIEDRNVTLLIPLRDTSISCHGGSLSVTMDNTSHLYGVGLPCSFDAENLTGPCSLAFSAPTGFLRLEARC